MKISDYILYANKLKEFNKWSKDNRDIIEYRRIIKDIIYRRNLNKKPKLLLK